MKKILYYSKKSIIFVGILTIFNIIVSALNLVGIPKNISSIAILVFQLTLFFILGFIRGKKTSQKAFLAGFKLSFVLVFLMLLLSLVFYNYQFKLSNIIFYLTLCCTGVFGAIIGKNKK